MKISLRKNFIYNIIYQIIIIIIPIITTPYISRVLGVDGLGANGYTYSFSFVFTIFILFGLGSYGSNCVAIARDNKNRLSRVFWNLWFMQFVIGSCFIIGYIILFIVMGICGYKDLFLAQLPLLLASLFDISWFFIGIEEIKKIVTRNLIVKIVALTLIFTIVKSPDNLKLYIMINSISMFLGSITYWMYIGRYVRLPVFSRISFGRYVRPAFLLLIPQLAIQVYTTLDKSVMGLLSDIKEVGYYDQSQKIARIALAVVTSLSTVLMPRIANIFANKEYDKINYYLKKSLNFTMGFSVYIACSIMAVSQDFVPFFFGKEFDTIIPYMIITSMIVIFIPIGGIFANQYCIPTGKTREYMIPLIIAAIFNISSNFLLIPKLGALGGVISIVLTEFIVLVLRILLVNRYLNIKDLFNGTFIYIKAGITEVVIVGIIAVTLKSSFVNLAIESIAGTIIYFTIVFLTKNELRNEILKVMPKKYTRKKYTRKKCRRRNR